MCSTILKWRRDPKAKPCRHQVGRTRPTLTTTETQGWAPGVADRLPMRTYDSTAGVARRAAPAAQAETPVERACLFYCFRVKVVNGGILLRIEQIQRVMVFLQTNIIRISLSLDAIHIFRKKSG